MNSIGFAGTSEYRRFRGWRWWWRRRRRRGRTKFIAWNKNIRTKRRRYCTFGGAPHLCRQQESRKGGTRGIGDEQGEGRGVRCTWTRIRSTLPTRNRWGPLVSCMRRRRRGRGSRLLRSTRLGLVRLGTVVRATSFPSFLPPLLFLLYIYNSTYI